MRFYIADLHFFHKNVIAFDRRKFASVEDMNDFLIKQWNAKVRKNDEVVVLGDFSFGDYKETCKILRQLNGKIFLLKGNHDRFIEKGKTLPKIQWIKDYAEMNDCGKKVILSHYPIMFYNKAYNQVNGKDITFMLCGHIHNTAEQDLLDSFSQQARKKHNGTRFIPSNVINCFCGYSNYTPLTLDEWVKADANRKRKQCS